MKLGTVTVTVTVALGCLGSAVGVAAESGQKCGPDVLTMAHRTLPFGTTVRVTNPANGRSVVVRVSDRRPYGGNLVGDVSLAAAKKPGFVDEGVMDARPEVVERRVAEP